MTPSDPATATDPLPRLRVARLPPIALLLALLAPAPLAALVLEMPAPATLTAERAEDHGDAAIPVAPSAEEGVPRQVEGTVLHQAWRLAGTAMTTLQLLTPLRDQLTDAGFDILFECEDTACGGFDFRYGLELIEEPDMHVDLGDFRYLAAERAGPEGVEHLALVVSRSASAGFVHLTRVGARDETEIALSAPDRPLTVAASSLEAALERNGRAVLADLVFATGATDLGPDPFPSLAALAAFLEARADTTVVLVGHTDAEGALDGNIALSRQRAEAVAARLVSAHGIAAGRLRAEGVGYLAPIASNATEEGRRANRRVEVVITTLD